MPSWDDLRYFLALSRGRTLAATARVLGVEHTTVSRRIAALESALGGRLFVRTPEGFEPTDLGAAIRPLAEQMEAAVAAVERRASGEDGRLAGTVRLTTSEGFTGFLVKRLSRLRERHPEILVEVLSGNQALDLTRREADLAVRFMRTTQPDLLCRKLVDTGWSLYAAESYLQRRGGPPDAANLAGHDLVGFDETMAGIPGAKWIEEHGQGASVVLRGNSIVSVLNAAATGMGLAVLPCFLGDAEPTLRRLTPAVLASRELWLVAHPDVAQVARVRAVIDFLVEIIRGEAAAIRGEPG